MAVLTLVGLPIGNPRDLTFRAEEFLRRGRRFFAEDTRCFKKLLRHLEIPLDDKVIESLHDADPAKNTFALALLDRGEDIALVSDAGSPLVSDPGFPLVRAALSSGHRVESLPGVSAPLVALEVSGAPPLPFTFHGFLPRKRGELERFFTSLPPGTHIAFESPRRIKKSVALLGRLFPAVRVSLARELTKSFEQVVRFAAGEAEEALASVPELGEFTLVFHLTNSVVKDAAAVRLAEDILAKPGKKALAKLLAHLLDLDVKDVYRQIDS